MAQNSDPHEDFQEILENDEEDSGSELDSIEDEQEMNWEPEIIIDESDDGNIEDMPIFSMDDEGNIYPWVVHPNDDSVSSHSMRATSDPRDWVVHPNIDDSVSSHSMRATSDTRDWVVHSSFSDFVTPNSPRANPEWRDRSPLRSPASPPYSPQRSPRQRTSSNESVVVVFRENEEVAHDLLDGQQITSARSPSGSVRGRSRGQPRSRGLRLRGGARGGLRGRGRRRNNPALSADAGEDAAAWRPGDRIIEVCLDDEDVPPALRQMITDLEAGRHARSALQMRKRENDRLNNEEIDDDEYYDAESFVVNELFDGDDTALNFQWSPMATFSGSREKFIPKQTGPTVKISSPYEAFRKFWDDEILEHIVTETNRYAEQLKLTSERFKRDWYDTNAHEIMILFAFWMMLGIIRMPSITSCFSLNPLLKTNIFRSLMTQPRYWILNRCLHFTNNATRTRDSSKLFSLGPLLEHLNRKFQQAYIPDQNIVIDESLLLWKGNLSFRQYIKTKAARFGIKTFELCESATGYLWSFFIYTGKDLKAPRCRLPKSAEVVVQLIRPLLNKGYRLFLDIWFNSPILARYLKRNKTDCVGTLRKTRINVPALIQLATVPKGKCVARHSGDVVLMAYQDQKPVYTISTCHGVESTYFESKTGKPSHYKPTVIADYNKNMGGVDRKDAMLAPYLLERKKNRKWYKKIFKRLLNISIFNSSILLDKSRNDSVKQQAFRLELVKSILERHLQHVPKPRQRQQASSRGSYLLESRFIGAHYITRANVPENGSRTSTSHRSSKNRRQCVWCMVRENRLSRTVYICDQCEIPLCLDQCFKKFHTVR